MRRNVWIVLSGIAIVIALAVTLVSGLKGGCSTMVETAMGGEMPMKCHWTFVATTLIGVAGLVSAVLAAVSTETQAKRVASCVLAIVFVLVLLAVNVVMGTCAGEGHPCGQTALIVNVLSAIGLVVAVVMAAGSKEDTRPRAKL